MAVNPHFLSMMGETPTLQIRDDLDFPHSGIFKALHLAAKGTYIIKESATDFDIAQSDGGTYTSLAIKGGAGFRHGKYVQIGSGSGTTTTILLDNSVAEGGFTTNGTSVTANQDVTSTTADVYLMVVADSSNAIKIRGRNADTNVIPMLISASDIPIAIIKMVANSDDDATDRPIQYLTTDLDDHSLSIGYASSDNYVEAMSIVSDADGDVTIENFKDDKDVIFKVSDGGVSTEVMRFDASNGVVCIGGETNGEATLHIRNAHTSHGLIVESTEASASSAPDITLYRNSASPADGDDIATLLFRGRNDNSQSVDYASILGEIDDASDTTEGGQLRFKIYADGTNHTVMDMYGGTSGVPSINIGTANTNKLGFYAATPIVVQNLAASAMGASAGTAATDAKVVLVANALVTLGLCNIA